MRFSFAPERCRVIPAQEYLQSRSDRGRSFSVRQLGLRFYALRDCLCLGQKSQAILPLESANSLPFIFSESCPYPANERQLPEIVRDVLANQTDMREVDEAVPLFPPGARNLWHWVTESLPKLLALELSGYSGAYIVPSTPVPAQTFELFNIAKERLLPGEAAYKVKNLILPQRLNGFSLAENMPLSGFLREKMLGASGTLPGGKRCYIRRIGKRRVGNEEALLELLREFNFEVMTPEDLSLREQWRYMSNADCSLMAHGANSTLALLQKPGAGFVELFGNRYVSYNNLHAVRLLRLRYHPIVEDLDLSAAPPSNPQVVHYLREGMDADIMADLMHVRIALEGIFA